MAAYSVQTAGSFLNFAKRIASLMQNPTASITISATPSLCRLLLQPRRPPPAGKPPIRLPCSLHTFCGTPSVPQKPPFQLHLTSADEIKTDGPCADHNHCFSGHEADFIGPAHHADQRFRENRGFPAEYLYRSEQPGCPEQPHTV